MISAQIKKGNTFLIDSLEDHMLQMITIPTNPLFKPLKMNYFNFLLGEFSRSKSNVSLNLFIIDYFVRKYEKNGDLYRFFFGFTQAWKKYADNHEDAKLFLSLLTQTRNGKQSIKRFIKIRKIILKTINAKILEEISVTHSDALTISHMVFEGDDRSKIVKKINSLFISLKRKLVNTANINGAVACQFFISAGEELADQNYPLQQLKNREFAQVGNIKRKDQRMNELSFSEEYANSYKRFQKQEEEVQYEQYDDYQIGKEDQLNIENLDRQWKNEKNLLNIEQARKSLSQLSQKDRDIDAKLQGSGLIEWKNMPNGWEEFIKNNQMQKQKLLNRSKN